MIRSPRPAPAAGGGRASSPAAVVAALLLALAAPLVSLSSCRGVPVDGFELDVPKSVASKVVWYEVGVFPGPGCAALGPQLAGGVPAAGFVKRLAFKANAPSPPNISDLPRATYAVGVAARGADCSVLATGCSDVDLAKVSAVAVTLGVTGTPEGACTNGATCEEAKCTPGSSDLGAGCSLAFVGGGPLADPLGLEGTIMSAPAVAATGNGFLIAYREWDPTTGNARITVIPIDAQGGIGVPRQSAQVSCQAVQTSDAAGLVFSGTGGIVAAARGGCPSGSGLADTGIDLATVDATGAFGAASFADLGQNPVLLSTAHAMAQSSAGSLLAYVQSNAASVVSLSGGSGTTLSAPTTFGGDGRAGDAWVAASDQVVALLAASSGSGAPASSDDAGTGGDGSAATDAIATPSASTLNFNLLSFANGTLPSGPIPAPAQFAGNWGSVSALAGRAFVASDGQTSDQPLAYRAFDLGSATPSVVAGYNPQGSGPVLYADVAFHQDHLFVAVERPGAITLDVFSNATTTPTLLREAPLSGDARIPNTTNVRDGRVAVLATDARVIVAWTTEESLAPDDATGGFAVFACTTP